MDIPAVSRRYAQALYDLTVEEKAIEGVRADLNSIRGMIGSIPDFEGFLDNPTISPEEADRMVTALFGETAHPTTMKFIRFLSSKGRLNHLQAVCDAYEQRICEDLGILKVRIVASHPLTDAQLATMKEKLHARYAKTIEATVEVDTTLLGGFKIQVGDRVRDFSLITKLDQFEQGIINVRHQHSKLKVKSWR